MTKPRRQAQTEEGVLMAMRKRKTHWTMWAVQSPGGILLQPTTGYTRQEAWSAAIALLSPPARSLAVVRDIECLPTTRRALYREGYRLVKLRVEVRDEKA